MVTRALRSALVAALRILCHDPRSGAGADAGAERGSVLVVGDVSHPVGLVLDMPVRSAILPHDGW